MRRTRSAIGAAVLAGAVFAIGVTQAADDPAPPWHVPGSEGSGATWISRPPARGNLFARVLDDQRFLITTWWPSEAQRWDFAAPLVGATLIASRSADVRLEQVLSGATDESAHDVAQAFTNLGDGRAAALLVGGSYLFARALHAQRLSQAADRSAEALASVAVYSVLLKQLTARTRPTSDGAGGFFDYQHVNGESTDSFPSGHTMTAFALATVLAGEYPDRRWVGWLAYGMASLVALSRVGLGDHYAGDVLAGAVIGRSLGRMVGYRDGHAEGAPQRNWHLEPQVDPSTGTLGVAWRMAW